jgi:hypothetical protein
MYVQKYAQLCGQADEFPDLNIKGLYKDILKLK